MCSRAPSNERYKRLEPYDGKLSRTVLRGGNGGNAVPLPDWRRSGKERQPWNFGLRQGELFGFAGLYDVWRTDTGWLRSCTILTTQPNELVAQLHDRMPVILPPDAEQLWLAEAAHPQQLVDLCKPLAATAMRADPVVPLVNNVANEGPGLRTPLSDRTDERQLSLLD